MADELPNHLRTVEHSIPIDILQDLLTRFLICVPQSAKENLIRVCFQIELAHWFYLDFYVANDARLKKCTIYEFAAHVFQHVPFLKAELPKLPQILKQWSEYKQSVPTYGAIILSEGMSHVLLVQSYWAKSSWSFPKGKVNEEEDPAHCAIREVLEETGFDISQYIDPMDFLESIINDQLVRLYVIRNVSMTTKFQPKTRCEIKACSWFPITDLPNNRKDSTPKVKRGLSANAFFMVLPFVKRLKNLCTNPSTTKKRAKSASISEGDYQSIKPKSTAKISQTDIKKRPDKPLGQKLPKRQLFPEKDQQGEFFAPSWLNFQFDKMALLDCMP